MLMENRLSLLQAKLSSMQCTQDKMHAENKKYQAAVDSHTDALDAILSRDVADMSQLQVQQDAASGAITPEALMDLTSERDAEQALLPVPSAPAMPRDIGLGDASNSVQQWLRMRPCGCQRRLRLHRRLACFFVSSPSVYRASSYTPS